MANCRSTSGFSLIEVVLAIGIIAAAVLPLVGLLGLATAMSRQAFAKTVGSQIASELIGQVQQADWADLPGWQNREFYYDNQGQQLVNGNQKDSAFTARVVIGGRQLNLGSSGTAANAYRQQFTVLVAAVPGALGAEAITKKLENQTADGAEAITKKLENQTAVYQGLTVNLQKQEPLP